MKTESLNKQSVDPKWYVVDADGQILGRFASKLADRLRGKDKPTFTPHTDGGDFVVVINAEKVAAGSKYDKKTYYILGFVVLPHMMEKTYYRQAD